MADLVQIIRGGVKRAVPPSSIDGNARRFTPTATKTAAYTAAAWDHVLVDASAAAGNFAVTMPASPGSMSPPPQVRVTMITDHATRVVTLDGNGSDAVEGDVNSSPGKYTLCLEGDSVLLEWVGGHCGWAVLDDGITPHSGRLYLNTNMTTSTASVAKKVNFDAEAFDIGVICDPTTNYRINIRRAGVYNLVGTCRPNAGVADGGYFINWVYLNGVIITFSTAYVGSASAFPKVPAPTVASLASGDYLEVYMQSSTTNAGAASGAGYSYLAISEVR